MHAVTPIAARTALHEILDSVLLNKILGFGGDYRNPERSHARLVMARRNIVEVPASTIESGLNSEADAGDHARMLLSGNAAGLFKLG
jgi:hypothetical protein